MTNITVRLVVASVLLVLAWLAVAFVPDAREHAIGAGLVLLGLVADLVRGKVAQSIRPAASHSQGEREASGVQVLPPPVPREATNPQFRLQQEDGDD